MYVFSLMHFLIKNVGYMLLAMWMNLTSYTLFRIWKGFASNAWIVLKRGSHNLPSYVNVYNKKKIIKVILSWHILENYTFCVTYIYVFYISWILLLLCKHINDLQHWYKIHKHEKPSTGHTCDPY